MSSLLDGSERGKDLSFFVLGAATTITWDSIYMPLSPWFKASQGGTSSTYIGHIYYIAPILPIAYVHLYIQEHLD